MWHIPFLNKQVLRGFHAKSIRARIYPLPPDLPMLQNPMSNAYCTNLHKSAPLYCTNDPHSVTRFFTSFHCCNSHSALLMFNAVVPDARVPTRPVLRRWRHLSADAAPPPGVWQLLLTVHLLLPVLWQLSQSVLLPGQWQHGQCPCHLQQLLQDVRENVHHREMQVRLRVSRLSSGNDEIEK